MNEKFLRLKQLAEMLGVSRSTIWRWHTERGLRVVTVGGVVRVRESDLNAFMEQHAKQGREAACGVDPT